MSTTYTGADTFTSTITIPSDGDADAAASVNVAFEALQDDATYLKNRIGGYRLINFSRSANENSTATTIQTWAGPANNSYVPANDLNIFTIATPVVAIGDIIEVTLTGTAGLVAGSAATANFRLASNIASAGDVSMVAAIASLVSLPTTSSYPLAIAGSFVAGAAGAYKINLQANVTGSDSVYLLGSLTAVLRHWRLNP